MTYYAVNFTEASSFTNMNMTTAPGRTYTYLNDSSYALWPFGFGLSYTEFQLHKPSAPAQYQVPTAEVTLRASVQLTNVGKVAGDEVVFLFLNATKAGLAHSLLDPVAKKQLAIVAFQRGVSLGWSLERVSQSILICLLSVFLPLIGVVHAISCLVTTRPSFHGVTVPNLPRRFACSWSRRLSCQRCFQKTFTNPSKK